MLQALLAQPLEDYDLSSLRYLISGAAPLARETADELQRRVPGVEIREGYGLTETSAIVSGNRPGRVRAGSVGEALPDVELRILEDDDAELPVGEVGEICCRSPFVMLGYWRAPELTADAMRGGWFHTGDLGYLDEDGYLYDRRPQEGSDHPRRLQRLPARRRGRAARASGRRRSRCRRKAGPEARRGGRRVRRAPLRFRDVRA